SCRTPSLRKPLLFLPRLLEHIGPPGPQPLHEGKGLVRAITVQASDRRRWPRGRQALLAPLHALLALLAALAPGGSRAGSAQLARGRVLPGNAGPVHRGGRG